ncbi:MAG: undecaprenyl/decaprenyl-phosphate alpha-N-acetylglucosaminyl 1-phosphate transferase [Geobacter sp.]|nr:MAG: undecaprenyl/decaprenyl-phosphate alpha-N-acetylglucosaminyl 1-phosphate transferase [Geobacter sp.]
MNLMTCFYIFVTALFSSLILVPYVHQWALDTGALDLPDERKVHRTAIPRVGGLAVALAFLFSLLVFVDFSREMRGIAAGGLILFATGLVDDLYGLSAKKKFCGEIFGCLIATAISHLYIHRLGDLFGTGAIELPLWLSLPFTIFAVVGVINAINLIDGLDGLAGGVSVIALAAFSFLGYQAGNYQVMLLCAGLLGGLLGFLKYNFFPARIFMGDAGSLVVGFVLAYVAIYLTQTPGSSISPVVPLVVLGLPVVDTLRVMAKRLLRRTSPFAPDRSHVHHKILDLGFQHRYTVVVIYCLSLFWAAFALVNQETSEGILLILFAAIAGAFYLGIRCVRGNRRWLSFLGADSPSSIRDSVTYKRLADLIVQMDFLIILLILAYIALTTLTGAQTSDGVIHVTLVLVVTSILLLCIIRDTQNQFFLAMLYFSTMLLAARIVLRGGAELVSGVTLKQASDFLLLGMVAIGALRLLFRRPLEFFLASIDYLFLGVSIFLAVVAPQVDASLQMTGVLARGIVLFIALKIAAMKGERHAQVLVYGMLSALCLILVRGYLH